MSAYDTIDTPIAGMKYGINENHNVITKRTADSAGLPFGMPGFGYLGASGLGTDRDKNVHTYKNDRCVMTFDGDFTAGDVITITVNGTVVTPVTFITDQATTMALVVAAIEADITGADATGAGRVLTIDIDGTEMTVTETVVGGTEATGTAVYSSRMLFTGFSVFRQAEAAGRTTLDGTVIVAASNEYDYKEAANIMTTGTIYVVTDSAVNNGAQVYAVVASGATQGQCTDTVGSNQILAGAFFDETVDAAGVARVRITKIN